MLSPDASGISLASLLSSNDLMYSAISLSSFAIESTAASHAIDSVGNSPNGKSISKKSSSALMSAKDALGEGD